MADANGGNAVTSSTRRPSYQTSRPSRRPSMNCLPVLIPMLLRTVPRRVPPRKAVGTPRPSARASLSSTARVVRTTSRATSGAAITATWRCERRHGAGGYRPEWVKVFSAGIRRSTKCLICRLDRLVPHLLRGTCLMVRLAADRFGFPDFTGRTILVVDDHDDSLNFLF